MMRSLLFLVAVLSVISINTVVVEAALSCPLCSSVADVPKRLDYILEINPVKRCTDAWLQLGALDINSPQCAPLQGQYREKCCGAAEPPVIHLPPTAPPADSNTGSGNEPVCRICKNDDYPGNPNAFIVARYVGEYTCGQLYGRGRSGLIPGFMCGPLQDFAYGVCKCEAGGAAPTSPAVSPVAPNSPPTADPSPDPSPAPVQTPTRDPSPDPSPAPVRTPTFELVPTALGARKVPQETKQDMKLSGSSISNNNFRALRGGREETEPLEV